MARIGKQTRSLSSLIRSYPWFFCPSMQVPSQKPATSATWLIIKRLTGNKLGNKSATLKVKGSVKVKVKGSVLGNWYSFIFFCLRFISMSTDLPIVSLFHPNPQPTSRRKYQIPGTDPFMACSARNERQPVEPRERTRHNDSKNMPGTRGCRIAFIYSIKQSCTHERIPASTFFRQHVFPPALFW